MPIDTREVLSLVMQLCEEENLKVTIKASLMGGAVAFTTTTLGGLLAGPLGLAVGGAFGGLTAALLTQGKFKSVAAVIREDLTPLQRVRLANSVRRIINNFGPEDLLFITAFTLQPDLKARVLLEVINFFHSQLNMQIEY